MSWWYVIDLSVSDDWMLVLIENYFSIVLAMHGNVADTKTRLPQLVNAFRMWNMISLPATPAVCLEQKSEYFQSRNVTLSMPSQSKK